MARTKQTARRSCLSGAAVRHLKLLVLNTEKGSKSRKPPPKRQGPRKASVRRKSPSTLALIEPEDGTPKGDNRKGRRPSGRDTRPRDSDVDSRLLSHEVTAAAHWSRYYQHGKEEDLEEAIRIDRESLKLKEGRAHKGASYADTQANLGVSLLDLYAKTQRVETLNEAISLLERALADMSTHLPIPSDREPSAAVPRAMVNLGNAYRARAELTGSDADLDRAILMHEDALMCTPGDHPEWDTEIRQNCLARSLIARGGQGDVERAMELMSARRLALADKPIMDSVPFRELRSYGYDADVGLPVPDLSDLISRLTSYPSGCGGFADIFIGEWNKTRRLKQRVAIKVLRPHAVNTKDKTVNECVNRMLRAEIRIWHGLDHPNIVKLLGTCRGFGPYPSMILPWFSNGSLSNYLQKHKSLIYTERLRFVREVASGLAYLHSHAIIHGDLTGGNVLVDDDHGACLSDFGLSVLARDFDLPSMSRFSSGIGGSIRWTAPELYAFDGDAPPRLTLQTDVYSFGSVAYEIFSGTMPYQDVQNEMEVLLKYVVPGITPVRPTGEKVVKDTHWDAVRKCWAKDPQARTFSRILPSLFQDHDTHAR